MKSNGSKILLSYLATIWIIFACPTNAFTTSRDLKHKSNINANMLWALLALYEDVNTKNGANIA